MLLKTFRSQLRSSKYVLNGVTKMSFATKMPVAEGQQSHGVSTVGSQIQPWVEVENRISKIRGELVLTEQDKIEDYVLGVVKGYFRTTYKDGVTLNSNLSDHGLDSLDSIELAMILEDELGKIILI